jgi:signal transduction histidine kinase
MRSMSALLINQQLTRWQKAINASHSLRRIDSLSLSSLRFARKVSKSSGSHRMENGKVNVAQSREQPYRAGVVEHAGVPLPYYPGLTRSPEAKPARFASVDELEFQKKDLEGALRLLDAMGNNKDSVVAGGALLRVARIQRKLGNKSKALDAFTELAKLGDVGVEDLPAALAASQGRALIFESAGRRDDLEREAAALCDDLENGRWMLSRAAFEFSYNQARQWLGVERPPIDPGRLALAEAADSLWREWQAQRDQAQNGRSRRTIQAGDIPILLLTRSTPVQHTAMLMSPRFLQSAWLGTLNSAPRIEGLDFALTDAEGRAVLGRPDSPLSMQSVRAASVTQLPWTVHVISRAAGAERGLSSQTKLMLAGIVVMGLVAGAAGYLINRAITRELRVARLQSDFVAAVSHEFRTPLTAVRQLAEMLVKGRVSSDERRQQFYRTLLQESERLHRLVEGLLNFGRMEAGQLQYHFEAIDPEDFVRSVISDFEQEVAGRGYHIELQGNGPLPRIRADRETLARAFWNLLDNAVKYSPENRTVCVDLSDVGTRLAVRVRDRGMGIPVPEQKEIFRKFVRGSASKNARIQGTGVGLAMAREIVAAHGGDISVESDPGNGSVFTVLLPSVGGPAGSKEVAKQCTEGNRARR